VKRSNLTLRAEKLSLRGLSPAPAQTWGAIRLVPLIRSDVRADLRLTRRAYEEDVGVALIDGRPGGSGLAYVSFIPHGLVVSWNEDIPHGLVVSWNEDGTPVASYGASLQKAGAARDGVAIGRHVRLFHRMVKREDKRQLRFLPLHLALEGFLELHFGGPEIAWPEYSRMAIRRGLDPRFEESVSGSAISGLEDALRVFEIHEGQSGVLVFVADALASAFVVPHPEDYRALHRSLIEDFYGELLYRYGLLYPDTPPLRTTIDDGPVRTLSDLRDAVSRMRREWAELAELLASGVLEREVFGEDVYKLGPFQLERFMTRLALHEENHIGERILRDDGTLEYMKTFRLSDAQARRAYLLSELAAHDWHLDNTAQALSCTRLELAVRLINVGFRYLLSPEVQLEVARSRKA
jgi:hypothetical protein